MDLCTLNEIYDYPFHVLFPILESINWSRDNPCFSWPSHAFQLIGRNDLAILKAKSDLISATSTAQAWYESRLKYIFVIFCWVLLEISNIYDFIMFILCKILK